MVQDEASKAGKTQVMQNLVQHSNDFEFYPQCNKYLVIGKSTEGF